MIGTLGVKMKIMPIIIVLVLVIGCVTTTDTKLPIAESKTKAEYEKLLTEGTSKLFNGHPKEAIENFFNPIIEYFEQHYRNNGERIYCSNERSETIIYLLKAAADNQSASVLSQMWADAFFYKGYAYVDLGLLDHAATWINKAIELSPSHSGYLSELGHTYQVKKKWSEAMGLYKQAEEAANTVTPDRYKKPELLRAMRGIGFILIELGRLDEAERKFKKCLEIDETDEKSLHQLEYIRHMRNTKMEDRSKP